MLSLSKSKSKDGKKNKISQEDASWKILRSYLNEKMWGREGSRNQGKLSERSKDNVKCADRVCQKEWKKENSKPWWDEDFRLKGQARDPRKEGVAYEETAYYEHQSKKYV